MGDATMSTTQIRGCCLLLLLGIAFVAGQELSRADAFTNADEDSDEILSVDELVAAVASLGMRSPETNAEKNSLVMKMDSNLDGSVSKDEFMAALSKGDSMVGKLGLVASKFIDNVGLLSITNQLAAAIGITPGNEVMDLSVFSFLSTLYLVLCYFGVKVSYFVKQDKYWAGFALASYALLLLFTVLDMNTEYPAGFTVLSFFGGLVGTADYFMEAASPSKRNAAHGRRNAASKAKRALG